jgi:hypothetical protein
VTIVAQAPGAPPAVAQESAGLDAALEESTARSRAAGEYGKALEAAEQLLDLWSAEGSAEPYDLESPVYRIETIRFAVSLQENERAQLARADSLGLEH